MASRKQKSAQRQLVATLGSWNDPHGGGSLPDTGGLKGMQVDDDGNISLKIKPSRAHCPCCLLDLIELRKTLMGKKQIQQVTIEVVEVPSPNRWTNSINE